MSKRSRAAYFAQIERPIAWCSNSFQCGNQNARFSKIDCKYLCKNCRSELRRATKGEQS